jgi:hypothetical protein
MSAQVDRLLSGETAEQVAGELDAARRLCGLVARLPPAPAELERRVGAMVHARLLGGAERCPRRWAPALWSALATAALLGLLWLVLPGLGPTGGPRSALAEVRAVLLGQTRIEVTPTLQPAAAPVRESLRDLVAAELLIGRAPSLPKSLPDEHSLQEVAALSYPELPAWISQPLCVEFCFGDASTPCALRLRQYRLLFRDFGGISGFKVAGDAVRDVEQVELQGATGMLFTLSPEQGQPAPSLTVVWERDGLLLELESNVVDRDVLLEVARSTR